MKIKICQCENKFEDKTKNSNRKYCDDCKIKKEKDWSKKEYQNNKQSYLDRATKRHNDNKEMRLKQMKIYYENNKEKIIQNNSKYKTYKRRTDIKIRLAHNLRRRLNHVLKGNSKSKTTLEILGCSLEKFKIYIEKQFDNKMTWQNYGSYWHLDHIIPLASAQSEKEIYKLCYYMNLQPLEARENQSKGAKLN